MKMTRPATSRPAETNAPTFTSRASATIRAYSTGGQNGTRGRPTQNREFRCVYPEREHVPRRVSAASRARDDTVADEGCGELRREPRHAGEAPRR